MSMIDAELEQLAKLLERSFDLPVAAKRPPGARGKTYGTDLRRALDAIEAEIADRAAARALVAHDYEIDVVAEGVSLITCSCGETIRVVSSDPAFVRGRAEAHANPPPTKPLEALWE